MAQRDYVARSGSKKKKKQTKRTSRSLLLLIALIVPVVFVGGLYLLKEKSADMTPALESSEKKMPKSMLPTPPEEVWSYIKALETRTVPVDDNPQSLEKNMRLTEEQKKVLLAMEQEQQAAENARRKQAEERKKAEEDGLKAALQSAEDKPVQEAKPAPVAEVKKAETKKPAEEVAREQPKKAETTQTAQSSATTEKKFGLQCGAFKNRQQAENMQARLAMAGFNARVNASADWNRVVVGPVGDRIAANRALEQAKSIAGCVVIGM
ncbi:cell division protein FtsN [Necropsobacter massiliensis]|uniref:cell division protein FtsN n=1 Tax=Necropsobacter massiliensis TaxID=1400001 RepID=UPI000596130F|nr:cell division protein FtsN [Necropsobacter massiliensis]